MSGVSSDMTADGAHPIPFDPEVYCQLTIHVQAIAAAPASGKLPTLAAAAEAMVHPILERRIDLADVIDRLQNACDAYGARPGCRSGGPCQISRQRHPTA